MSDARPLLVFFWSERSGPARRMESLLAHLARKERARLRVMRVDVDAEPELALRFKVEDVPTLVLVKGKSVVDRIEGRASAPTIESMLQPHLARTSNAGPGASAPVPGLLYVSASSRRMTARPNSAARAPSTTRWSNVSET